ncbi:hypothetical protein IPU70_07910 [Achromobacter sp. SD115]|uniref:hypothetical protein n=1 Tax=Achromobacter sp. SD115 TaxID=2782011 RepID=UPI001A972B20|nr:hypothetical protein [Achromobacter sp. SD115]MBO1013468.1 hypothetical protein [Achromobacter sp. SD115]
MTTNHTRGPWRIGKSYGAVVSDVPVNAGLDNDHTEAYGGHLIAESVAVCNRPLIAAAPELFEAAEAAMALIGKLDPIHPGAVAAHQRLDLAIAKAKGEQQ